MRNITKERLKAGKAAIGVGLQFTSPALVEIAGYAGFHWVYIDCEHGPMSEESVENMVRAAEISGITPVVRPSAVTPEAILRYLDLGAQGIIVPHVETKADAEAAVSAIKYPPQGDRGLAGVRWSKYGTAGPLSDLIKDANDMTMVIALIESVRGVENIEAIISVPGVDAIHIGPNDLSASLGLPGQGNHPTVRGHMDRIIAACVKSKMPVGSGANTVEEAKKLIEQGCQLVYAGGRDLFFRAGRAYIQGIGAQ